jgi:hypothetical protein
MPSVSKSQQRLMQAAEHGADFAMARKVRSSMTHDQMHDFAVGSEAGKPQHVKSGARHQGVYEVDMRESGKKAQQKSRAPSSSMGHPHKNLGSYLHKPKRKRDTESSIAGKSR